MYLHFYSGGGAKNERNEKETRGSGSCGGHLIIIAVGSAFGVDKKDKPRTG
jgi:hypothetical protein